MNVDAYPRSKFYIAARFSRQEEMRKVEADLKSFGHEVTSRWLYEESTGSDETLKAKWARYDVEDVRNASTFLFFAEDEDAGYMTGGRHVEFGMAVAFGMQILVIGGKENIFHHLTWDEATRRRPQIIHYETYDMFVAECLAGGEFPLPLQGRPERLHLYRWVKAEEEYVAGKFDDQRNGHDETLAAHDLEAFWNRQIIQYLDRARLFLQGARESSNEDECRALEMRAQQAMAKCFMTAKGLVESSIRVYGDLPKPGLSSGNVEEWK